MGRSIRRHRLVLAGITASVVFVCGSFAFVQHRADASWRELQRRSDELRENARNSEPRAPLFGTGTDERAFEHYEKAAALARPLVDEHGQAWIGLPVKSDSEIVAATRDLRASWQSALAELAAGAHARDVTRAIEPGDEGPVLNLLAYRALCNMAAFEARALRQAGGTTRAVEVSLDALTLGADVIRDGILINQMIGAALVAITVQAWPEDALRLLDDDALGLFAGGLETLDELLPDRLVMDRELLFVANSLLRAPDAGPDDDWCGSGTWRYGFSTRWMIADAFVETYDRFATATEQAATNWRERRQEYDRVVAEAATTANPVAALMCPNLGTAEHGLRRAIAELRLLRLAVDAHRGLDPAPLPDPLGSGPFACQQSDDAVTWTSAGAERSDELTRTVRR